VVSQFAVRRTREIGLRMALGATAGGVRWMVLRHAFRLVLTGVTLGLPAAAAIGLLLKSFLYGLGPLHPTTLVFATFTMLLIAAVAAYLPARRASRVDPMLALRSE
jgi:ABC-type antimicrobial peptide transport system permease subunit